MSVCLIIGDVNINELVKIVLARYIRCKVFPFSWMVLKLISTYLSSVILNEQGSKSPRPNRPIPLI